ncbi:MAG: O-antigen ligase family protein [Caldilineales bacterium]|nr:O-antigen ligase family protein [Caldilineales bacterium]MDW8317181.1 O-antigen ligase family protein [Anaerolineae bacterium]
MELKPSSLTRSPNALALATLLGVLYLLTALLAAWATYDRGLAQQRFSLLAVGVLAALAIAWLGQWRGEAALALAGLACAGLAAGVAAYFLLTYDWQALQGDAKPGFELFLRLGLWIQAHRPAVPVPEDIQRNVAGSALGLTTPLAAGSVAWCLARRRFHLLAWPALAAVLFSAFTLAMTMSRGALLGVGVGLAVAAYLAWRRRAALAPQARRLADLAVAAVGLAGAVGLFVLLTRSPLSDQSAASRPQLWAWATDLIADYPFTGSGLGVTMMVHATYLLIIHVGFISHMHNLFLQIGIEQGIPGMAAFIAWVAVAWANVLVAYGRRASLSLVAAAVVALSALVVHGMFDAVPFYSRLASLAFLPLGFAVGLTAPAAAQRAASSAGRPRVSPAVTVAVALLAVALVLTATLFSQRGQAALQTNLAAVAQTRAELGVYSWPEWPIQDALRRSPQVDLAPAVARYAAALALDPRQPSANRRLGQIELSRGQYADARRHLEMAYQQAPARQANRYLLGESYAIEGQVEEAVALWRTTSSQLWWQEDWLARAVLTGREYWYTSIGEPQRAEGIRQARQRLASEGRP